MCLARSGAVYTFGKNAYGELGTGNVTQSKIPKKLSLENIAKVEAIDNTSYGVTEDGTVYAWGKGYTKVPAKTELEEDFIEEPEGNIKEKLVKGTNEVYVTLGGKVYTVDENGQETLREDVENIERVSAGYNHTAVYDKDGNIYTWGQGEAGELGNGEYFTYEEAQKVGKGVIETNTNRLELAKGKNFDIDGMIDYFNLFEKNTAEIYYEIIDQDIAEIDRETGNLTAKKVGRTTAIAKEVGSDRIAVIPVTIYEQGKVCPQIVTKGGHTLMLKVDGTVWAYGTNENGELGIGNLVTQDKQTKVIFPEGIEIKEIQTGERHSLALDTNGNVWAWGDNSNYQLGNNISTKVETPIKVIGLSNIRKIACGGSTSYAINELGEIYSFGLNENGEGGTGSYTKQILLTKAKNIADIIDIKAGKNYAIALKSTGEVYVTGSNIYGELGENLSENRKINKFTKVQEISEAVMVSAGSASATILNTKGEVYTWGSNLKGELGIGEAKSYIPLPTKVPNLADIRYIEAGNGYQMAINKQGEVFGAGQNSLGEFGNGNNIGTREFIKIETIEDVFQVANGNTHTNFLKLDGTVWATRRLFTWR